MTLATLECDWCDVPATELRVWEYPQILGHVRPDHICAACFDMRAAMGTYTDLPLSDRKPVMTVESLSVHIATARAIMTDPDPGSIETQRRIAAFMEATK